MLDQRVLYAFLIAEVVKYIGVCEGARTTLIGRMRRYQGLTGGGTNKRIACRIKERLEAGEKVEIYGFCPSRKLTCAEMEIDVVKGLENPLISFFRPEWNIRR